MSTVTWMWPAIVLLAVGVSSCDRTVPGQPSPVDLGKTGLEGTVRLGPTEPVCRVGQTCDAPVQAEFSLQQHGQVAARFASDRLGHFVVYASPGTYLVVPGETIGLFPQTPVVTVQAESLTHRDLAFDTGIR